MLTSNCPLCSQQISLWQLCPNCQQPVVDAGKVENSDLLQATVHNFHQESYGYRSPGCMHRLHCPGCGQDWQVNIDGE